MSDVTAELLPIYFVPDQSGSMVDLVDELNIGLIALLDKMNAEKMVAEMVRFSIVGFNDYPREHLRLANLLDVRTMPKLAASGMTSYARLFDDLRQRIEADVMTLRAEGAIVIRPLVFLLTDGNPNGGDWRPPLMSLREGSFRYHPTILAFGLGQADADVIREVATPGFAYLAAQGADAGTVLIANFMKSFVASVVSSAHSVAEGDGGIAFDTPKGYIPLKPMD